jgi:hypothetical protein
MERDLRPFRVEDEPPRVSEHGSTPDVNPNDHVTEEQPFSNKRLSAVSWRNPHDRMIWWVKPKSGGRQTVCNKVDPQELYWDKGLWHAEQNSQKYAMVNVSIRSRR